MNEYTWKILDITNNGDLIISAHYFLSATDGENIVETEGNHTFENQNTTVSLNKLYEQIIINKINEETTIDGVSNIKSRLDEQLAQLKLKTSSGLPWMANTFTPNF